MTDDFIIPDDTEDEEPAYCSLCGDPVTGYDQFCAGCGTPTGEGQEQPEEE